MNVGSIILMDGYKGDKVPRMGRVEGYALPANVQTGCGNETIFLLRMKNGDNGQYRQYHVAGMNNARVVPDTLASMVGGVR